MQNHTSSSEEVIYCSSFTLPLPYEKIQEIWACPDILVLRLNRVKLSQGKFNFFQEKNNNFVDFPLEGLDLTSIIKDPKFSTAPPIYDLYALTNHIGNVNRGHYTAFCMNYKNKNWYKFNDMTVTNLEVHNIVQNNAYVLFYKRRSCKWGGMMPLPYDR